MGSWSYQQTDRYLVLAMVGTSPMPRFVEVMANSPQEAHAALRAAGHVPVALYSMPLQRSVSGATPV